MKIFLTKQKIRKTTALLCLSLSTLAIVSCSNDEEQVSEETGLNGITQSNNEATSPFRFDNQAGHFEGDVFQIDPDSRGAHNWTESEYADDPSDNGTDISNFIYLDGDDLILECPTSRHDTSSDAESRRRAEFRDQVNIDLGSGSHRMELTFTIENYNGEDEIIIAQLHNDGSIEEDGNTIKVERPYLTVSIEDEEIELKRSHSPVKGSATDTSRNKLNFDEESTYTIRIDTGSNSTTMRVSDDTNNRSIEQTFEHDGDIRDAWSDFSNDYYWKFGAYMPKGGSDGTQMRLSDIDFRGQ